MFATASVSQKSAATGPPAGGSGVSPNSNPTRLRSPTVPSGLMKKRTAPMAKIAAKNRSQAASRRSAAVSGATSGARDARRAISASGFDQHLQGPRLRGTAEGTDRVVQRIHRVDERRNGDPAAGEGGERRREGAAAGADDGHLVDDGGREVEAMLAGDGGLEH